MLFYALLLHAHSKSVLLTSMHDQFVSQVVAHIEGVLVQFLQIEVLNAFVVVQVLPWIFFVADLAHDQNLRAVVFDMLKELLSSHMLELFAIANITSEFRAVELGVSLELSKSLPYDFSSCIIGEASMWEFAEVNAVSKYLVDLLQEITSCVTVGARSI